MKVPLSWLREFVSIPVAVDQRQLTDLFNNLGLVVEGVEQIGHTYEGIVTAKVLSFDRVPKSDHLMLVQVDVGDGTPLAIICGASNYAPGDVVPLATIGTTMVDGRKIERRPVLGIKSNGMLCSARELELSDDHSGIMILPPETALGVSLRQALSIESPDLVFDLAVEANRPDAMSIRGVARDLAAQIGVALTVAPSLAGVTDHPPAAPVRVSVEAADLCPRFIGAVLRGVTICPSPPWIAGRLTLAGMRPINNVVDVSNYVMLELGHPNHAYDLKQVGGGRIGTRWAKPGETLETLDGVTRTLAGDPATHRDGVIVDGADVAIGLAGIMGGASSEIADDTTDVLLEAAHWWPMALARTTKRLSIRTEASARFEKGCDPETLPHAVARFVELLRLTCPGLSVESYEDVRVSPAAPTEIHVRTARVNLVLGTTPELIDDVRIAALLTPIGFNCRPLSPGVTAVTVPTFRPDVTEEINVIEEVGRHFGYRNIPRRVPLSPLVGQLSPLQRDRRSLRRLLTSRECDEAWTATLLAPADLSRAGQPVEAVALSNPMVAEESVLRTSLLPGLLRALAYNASHRNPAIRLFEIGHVFSHPRPGQVVPYERERVAVALAGNGDEATTARALFDAIVAQLGTKPRTMTLEATIDLPGLHATRSARIITTGTNVSIGSIGEVDPRVAEACGIPPGRRVAWLEFDLENLCGLARQPNTMKPFTKFPSTDVDLAFVTPDGVAALTLENALRRAGGQLLDSISLFDVFRSPAFGAGMRSLAYRFRFSAIDRTLTDAEVTKARQGCIDAATKLGATLRA